MRVIITTFALTLLLLTYSQISYGIENDSVYVYPDHPDKKATYSKMESQLSDFLDVYFEEGLVAAEKFAEWNCIDLKDEMVRVELCMRHGHLPGEISDATLKQFGAVVEDKSEHFIILFVPIEQLDNFAQSIEIISLVHRPMKFDPLVTSEGFEIVGAPPFHDVGIRGEGVRIAIIDTDYRYMRDLQGRGELPADVTTMDYTGRGIEGSTWHGTSCAEILYDFAPEAEYWFVKASSGSAAEMENALRYVIRQEVDILSMSMGQWWSYGSYFDGNDPLSRLVDQVFENGILPVIAAGNHARKHYRADFNDPDEANFHTFGENDDNWPGTINQFYSYFDDEGPVWFEEWDFLGAYLVWDDWPETDQDYAIRIWRFDADNQVWIHAGWVNGDQNGAQPPGEIFEGRVRIPGNYGVSVVRINADRDMNFTLWAKYIPENDFRFFTPEGSILTPARARNAFSVGAVHQERWNDEDVDIEDWSSRGPVYDGPMKPEICGPTWVSTLVMREHNNGDLFGGTSAVAPHVAGAAALVLSENPDMTTAELRDYLQTHAIDEGPEGLDNSFGFGKLNIELGQPEPRELPVPLHANWNMISINVTPDEEMWEHQEGPDVILMTEQLRIDEENHHLLLLKDEDGRFYLPAFGFNNIPYWNLTEGYLIKVDEDIEACWGGEPIPADADIPLERDWNLIAYYPTYELDASAPDYYVLSPIIDNVLIAKDGDGNFMLPAFEFSNMPPWREAQGYQVRVDEAVVLNYPPEREELAFTPPYPPLETRVGEQGVVPTGENMSLLISSISGFSRNLSDQIGAFSSDGRLVGIGIIDSNGRCGLAVWGDDPLTDEIDGLLEGEVFELRLMDSGQNLSIESIQGGQGLVYKTDEFRVLDVAVESTVPTEFYLSQAYPNPFNSTTRISYGLPVESNVSLQLYDLSGRLIQTLVAGERQAGIKTTILNAADLPSGLYFTRLSASGHVFTRKVMLVR